MAKNMAKIQRETFAQMQESGHTEMAVLLRDIEEEVSRSGQLPRPKPGSTVVIFTVTFFFKGTLLGEDHEYYLLAPGCEKVYETGSLETFYGGTTANSEKIPRTTWIRKGPTVSMTLFDEESKTS